jgi:hypothetical protein
MWTLSLDTHPTAADKFPISYFGLQKSRSLSFRAASEKSFFGLKIHSGLPKIKGKIFPSGRNDRILRLFASLRA